MQTINSTSYGIAVLIRTSLLTMPCSVPVSLRERSFSESIRYDRRCCQPTRRRGATARADCRRSGQQIGAYRLGVRAPRWASTKLRFLVLPDVASDVAEQRPASCTVRPPCRQGRARTAKIRIANPPSAIIPERDNRSMATARANRQAEHDQTRHHRISLQLAVT